jgi:hypothetical protein
MRLPFIVVGSSEDMTAYTSVPSSLTASKPLTLSPNAALRSETEITEDVEGTTSEGLAVATGFTDDRGGEGTVTDN